MMNIDQYAYTSKLRKNDPKEKLFFSVSILGICLWANSIIMSILILSFMAWHTLYKGGISPKRYLKLIMIPTSFLGISIVAIVFGLSDNPYDLIYPIKIFGVYVGMTELGIQTAAVLFFKAIASVACLYDLSLNTPMTDILIVLKKMKFPPLLIELMILIYRFIFVLMETAERMFTAQNSRLGYANYSSAFRSVGMLGSNLFIRAFRRADDIYNALESRGYDGELNVHEEILKPRYGRYLVILSIDFVFIGGAMLVREIGGRAI